MRCSLQFTLLTATILAFSGCGGGGGDSASAPPANQAAQAPPQMQMPMPAQAAPAPKAAPPRDPLALLPPSVTYAAGGRPATWKGSKNSLADNFLLQLNPVLTLAGQAGLKLNDIDYFWAGLNEDRSEQIVCVATRERMDMQAAGERLGFSIGADQAGEVHPFPKSSDSGFGVCVVDHKTLLFGRKSTLEAALGKPEAGAVRKGIAALAYPEADFWYAGNPVVAAHRLQGEGLPLVGAYQGALQGLEGFAVGLGLEIPGAQLLPPLAAAKAQATPGTPNQMGPGMMYPGMNNQGQQPQAAQQPTAPGVIVVAGLAFADEAPADKSKAALDEFMSAAAERVTLKPSPAPGQIGGAKPQNGPGGYGPGAANPQAMQMMQGQNGQQGGQGANQGEAAPQLPDQPDPRMRPINPPRPTLATETSTQNNSGGTPGMNPGMNAGSMPMPMPNGAPSGHSQPSSGSGGGQTPAGGHGQPMPMPMPMPTATPAGGHGQPMPTPMPMPMPMPAATPAGGHAAAAPAGHAQAKPFFQGAAPAGHSQPAAQPQPAAATPQAGHSAPMPMPNGSASPMPAGNQPGMAGPGMYGQQGQATEPPAWVRKNGKSLQVGYRFDVIDTDVSIRSDLLGALGISAAGNAWYRGSIPSMQIGLTAWRGATPNVRGLTRLNPGSPAIDGYGWMVQLLPHMGYQDLYQQFNFKNPWADEANRKLASTVIPEFLNPSDPRERWHGHPPMDGLGLSHFAGMSGIEDGRSVVAAALRREDPRAGVFGYDRIARPDEITDGQSNTIMIVGSGRSVGPWIQGGGATIRGAREPYFNSLTGLGSRGLAEPGTIVMFADGSTHVISPNIDPAVFRALCTIHGGESVDPQQLQSKGHLLGGR